MRNSRVARPFEPLVRFLELPRAGSVDPTLLMALFLPLMFGAMVGDVGYGVVLLVARAPRPALGSPRARRRWPASTWVLLAGCGVVDRLRRPLRRAVRRPRHAARRRLGAVAVPAVRRGARAAAAVRRRDRRGPRRARARSGRLAGRSLPASIGSCSTSSAALLVLGGLFGLAGWAADQLPAGALDPVGGRDAVVGLVLVMSPHGALGLITGPLDAPGPRSGTSSPTCGSPPSAWPRRISRASRTSSDRSARSGWACSSPPSSTRSTWRWPSFSPMIQALRLHYVEFFGTFLVGGGRAFTPFGHDPEQRHPTHDLKEQDMETGLIAIGAGPGRRARRARHRLRAGADRRGRDGADRREARAGRSRDPARGDPGDARHPRLRGRRDDDRAALTMALADLLRAIEADADAERARADRETAAEAAAIVERRAQEASALEAELSGGAGGRGARRGRPRRAPSPACEAARRSARRGRRRSPRCSPASRAELAALRGSDAYPGVFAALLAESRAALPAARELRVDRRDVDLARAARRRPAAWSRRSTPGADSSWRATTAGPSGTRSRSASPTPSRCFAGGSRIGSTRHRTCGVRLTPPAPISPTATRGCTPGAATLLRGADYERLIGEDVDGLLEALEDTPLRAGRRGGAARRRAPAPPRRDPGAPEPLAGGDALVLRRPGARARRRAALALRRPQRPRGAARPGTRDAPGRRRAGRADRPWAGWSSRSRRDPPPARARRRRRPARPLDARTAEQAGALRAAFGEYERTEDLAALERAVVADHAARAAAALVRRRPGRRGRCSGSRGARSTSATS